MSRVWRSFIIEVAPLSQVIALWCLASCGPPAPTSISSKADSSEETSASATSTPTNPEKQLEVVAATDVAGGNIAVLPEGTVVVSIHQFFHDECRLAFVRNGKFDFFSGGDVDSVLGIAGDRSGRLWLLDNGLRGGTSPALRCFVVEEHGESDPALTSDTVNGDLSASLVYDLSEAAVARSFMNDLAIDETHHMVYIADPAAGSNAALVVLDLDTRKARRVLEGHPSVQPENVDLMVDGQMLMRTGPDGKKIPLRVGVNPIALDQNDEWLYFGAMNGNTLYRIATSVLRDPSYSDSDLAGQIECYAEKPVCDGIAIDEKGNVYLGDLANDGVGVIRPDRSYEILVQDERLSFVNAFAIGPDEKIYFVANQLHRAPALHQGVSQAKPPFFVFRLPIVCERE